MTHNTRISPIPEIEVPALLKEWFYVGQRLVIDELQSGTVLGFGKKYVNRGGINHKLAGVYIDFTNVLLKTRIGSEQFLRRQASDFGDPEIKKRCGRVSDIMIKIDNLPETPFWVGDAVMLSGHPDHVRDKPGIITEIYYSNESGEEEYELQTDNGAKESQVRPKYLRLISRGNIWKCTHGEPIDFTSIEKEVEFYKSLGMSRKIDTDGVSAIPLRAAIDHLLCGNGDDIRIKDKDKMLFVVITYDNKEFGERMRKHTLSKFGFTE